LVKNPVFYKTELDFLNGVQRSVAIFCGLPLDQTGISFLPLRGPATEKQRLSPVIFLRVYSRLALGIRRIVVAKEQFVHGEIAAPLDCYDLPSVACQLAEV
jgi:hypothetical protein